MHHTTLTIAGTIAGAVIAMLLVLGAFTLADRALSCGQVPGGTTAYPKTDFG